jgi:phosphoglycerate dehydrogenase-like enzyme
VPRIAVTSPSFSANAVLTAELEALFPDVTYNETGRILAPAEVAALVRNADAAIVGREHIDDALLEDSPRLRMIAKYGVGLDNIDEAALARRGVVLGWTGGVNRRSVSELALCSMIGLLRHVVHSSTNLRAGTWRKEGGRELSGSVVGIVGLGHVGLDLARLLAPFGCTILVNDLRDVTTDCATHRWFDATKDRIWAESDVVSLHVPLTSATHHLVNAAVLARMRNDAYLINTSRGAVVDEQALLAALQAGRIAGAALDVFAVEPPTDRALLDLPNVLATPHIGGASREAALAMGRSAIHHLAQFFRLGESRA